MEVVLSDDKTYGSVACTVMDSVASDVVPKALLANFAAGDTGASLSRSTLGPTPSATFQ